jgi:hypothetical protein
MVNENHPNFQKLPEPLKEAVRVGKLKNGAASYVMIYAVEKYGINNVLGCLGNSLDGDLVFLEFKGIENKDFDDLMEITDYLVANYSKGWIFQGYAGRYNSPELEQEAQNKAEMLLIKE